VLKIASQTHFNPHQLVTATYQQLHLKWSKI